MSAHGSFMKSLFFGVVDEADVMPYPSVAEAEGDTVNQLVTQVRRFAQKHVDAAEIDRSERVPEDVLRGLRDLGLFGLTLPRTAGGKAMSHTGAARVLEELGAIDASVAMTVGAHLLAASAVSAFGTDAQRAQYLPKLATGEQLCAFALAEPGAGTDAAALQTRAEPTQGGYLLTGLKSWVTGGRDAELFVVLARTSPANDDGAKPRLTAFLVERGMGVQVGVSPPKHGVRGASTVDVTFPSLFVPDASVLGELGRGFRVAAETLNGARLGLAASSIGASKRLIALATERCQSRRAFARPIGQFGLIKDKIAIMLAEVYAQESMTFLATRLADARVDFSIESAMCKVYGSEVAVRVAEEAMQIAAGSGYLRDAPYERLLRDARANLVYMGTSEILRCFIALSGMAGPGQALVDVSRAMREPIKGFGLLSDFALRKARSALGRERLSRVHPSLSREALVFEQYTAELGRCVSKVLKKHGKDIAEMQYTQRRVADVATDLFAVAAVLSRTSAALDRREEEGARRERDLTLMFVAAAERRLAANVAAFDKNDDELRKAIADRAYADGGYPFDVV